MVTGTRYSVFLNTVKGVAGKRLVMESANKNEQRQTHRCAKTSLLNPKHFAEVGFTLLLLF